MSLLRVVLLVASAVSFASCDYWSTRDEFIRNQEAKALGGSLILNEKEQEVNTILMAMKLAEYDRGFSDPASFIPSRHLFETLGDIETSEVFQFIKTVPKGSMLHGHDTGLVSYDFLYNLTYRENLYACYIGENINFRFFAEPVTDSTCDWELVSAMRETHPTFETDLRLQLTLIRPDFRTVYTDINVVWQHFMHAFTMVEPLIGYKPVFKDYFYQVLYELYEDNVMYMEFRTILPPVYDLDGTQYGPIEVAGIYKETTDEFLASHPDFLGAKLIFAPHRGVDNDTMDGYIEIARELQRNYPTFLAGFDLVGQEDLGLPLKDFVAQLEVIGSEMNLFFHAGETNWYGTTTDFNVVDAVLLGTKRIGHGYAILKHPDVAAMVKEKGIAVEICPISNQVLMLLGDMRNHPGNYLIANGFPVVITNDDPSFWGTKALSYDWYMAYMGMASRNADLRFLKQLAINSIQYSTIDDKDDAFIRWEEKWEAFLDNTLAKQSKYYYEIVVMMD